MKDALKKLVEFLFNGNASSVDGVTTDILKYNVTTSDLVGNIARYAVMPVALTVLAIVMMVELNRKASHIEADHQTGVKLIAAVIFKYIILVMAVKNSNMLLIAIRALVSTVLNDGNVSGEGVSVNENGAAVSAFQASIDKASSVDQVGMLIFLLIPFLVTLAAKATLMIVVLLRFAELYMLTAFAPLPFAFLGNDETKSFGTSFLRKYVEVCIHGVCIVVSVQVYKGIISAAAGSDDNRPFLEVSPLGSDDPLAWLVGNYLPILITPVILMMVVLGSGKIAKAIAGNS